MSIANKLAAACGSVRGSVPREGEEEEEVTGKEDWPKVG
jgi:hypothetical protein